MRDRFFVSDNFSEFRRELKLPFEIISQALDYSINRNAVFAIFNSDRTSLMIYVKCIGAKYRIYGFARDVNRENLESTENELISYVEKFRPRKKAV